MWRKALTFYLYLYYILFQRRAEISRDRGRRSSQALDNLQARNGRLCKCIALGLMKPQNVTTPMTMQMMLTM